MPGPAAVHPGFLFSPGRGAEGSALCTCWGSPEPAWGTSSVLPTSGAALLPQGWRKCPELDHTPAFHTSVVVSALGMSVSLAKTILLNQLGEHLLQEALPA